MEFKFAVKIEKMIQFCKIRLRALKFVTS